MPGRELVHGVAGAARELKPQIPWLRVFVEGVVIVGSILLAFGIDAAWEGAQERDREQEVLEVLRAELASAGQALQVQLDIYVYLERATEDVANRLEARGSGSVMVSDTLLAALVFDMSYDPPTGMTNTLLASGQLDLLRNLDLRTAIAEWPSAIEDGVEEQTSLWRLGDQQLEPLLHDAVPSLGRAYSILSVWENERRLVSGLGHGELTVTASPALWNVLYQRLSMIRSARADLEGVTQAHLRKLVTLVGEAPE